MSDQQVEPSFSIEKIYVKDLSVEVPFAPQIFLEQEQPEVDLQLNTNTNAISDDYFENVVNATVTAKLADKIVFIVEASQAAVFQIKNVPKTDMPLVLNVACPNIVFPYLRELISDVIVRSGFPPVLLAPINFEALYAQNQAGS